MLLPADFDQDRPTAELVAELVASGAYDEDEATALVEMIKAGEDSDLE